MHDPNRGDEVPVHLDHLWALLDGYERVRPLSHAEATALAPMLALCHAEFALTEADYFLGVLHSPEKARVATRDYLVGHAQWFSGPGQQKILDPLRRWAESRERSGGARMILSAIAHYLATNWVELAGFVTTALGIWLTTKRLLICWPVVLAADVLYLVVFYRARLFSDALLQIFFIAFTLYGWWHWWRGVREEGEVRVVPLAHCRALSSRSLPESRAALCSANSPSNSTPRCPISTPHSPASAWSAAGGRRANTSPTGGSGSS